MKSVRSKLLFGFGIIIGLVALMVIIYYLNLSRIKSVVLGTASFNEQILSLAYKLEHQISTIEVGKAENQEKDIRKIKENYKILEEKCLELPTFMKESITSCLNKLSLLIKAIENGDPNLRKFFTSYIQSTEEVIKKFGELQAVNLKHALTNSLIVGIVIGVIAVGIALITTKNLILPIKNALVLIENISKGILNVSLKKIKSKDEIGKMINAIENLRKNLQGMITGVSDYSHELTSVSEELSAATEELSANLNETAKNLDKISKEVLDNTASLQEIEAGMKEFTQTASDNAKAAENTLKESNTLFQMWKR